MKRLVLLLALAACARELRSTNPDNWIELQSEHFVLRTDLPQDAAHKAAADLELVRNGLLAVGWSSPHPSPAKIVVVALAGRRETIEFLSERQDGIAFYGVFGEHVVLVDGEGDLANSELVKHEVTHALLFDLLITSPRWVQEGLACYLETMEIDRDKGQATRGKADWHRLDYLRFHPPEGSDRPAIPRIKWSSHILGPDSAREWLDPYGFETLSWLLVHWLVDSDGARFDRFVARLAHGDNMWLAFNGIYPELDESRLEAELNAFLLRPSQMRRATLHFESWKGEIAQRHLGAAEVHALRAELFLFGSAGKARQQSSKEIALSKAIDPGNPVALALDESDPGPAIRAHPEDWRAWALWHQKNPSDMKSIRKALELAPDNGRVLALLAVAEQNHGEKEAALRHGVEAVTKSPGAVEFEALSRIYEANGRCEDALAAQQRAIDTLGDGADRMLVFQFRGRLMNLATHCSDRPVAASERKTLSVKPVLKSCQKPMRVSSGHARPEGVSAEFTIREDGTVTSVVIKGAKNQTLSSSFRRFVESCTFEPVIIDGQARQLQGRIDFGEFTR